MPLGRVLLLAAVLAAPAGARDEPLPVVPAGPFNNEYVIEVTLDPDTMTLHGTEDVTFRNFSDVAVAEVPFHLYANAWANTGTQWIRDGRDEAEVLRRGAADGGYLAVDAIADAAGNDLGDHTLLDGTLMRVSLPEPLPPGGEQTFRIRFRTKLPAIVARMGKFGRHVNAMQWFPKLCAHVDGRFVDWPFRNPSEFFADFGRYQVSITVPEEYVLGATGTPQGEARVAGGLRTVTYAASAVHDFAWCANPGFIEVRRTLEEGPDLILLAQPFLPEAKRRLVLDVTEFAIDRYAEWFFPYPYPSLVIDMQPHGSGGGMEYPMLFTISSRTPFFLDSLSERTEEPAGVTVHEFSHQYWYGIVATNEFEEAWLDEGITTYMTYKVMERFFRGRGEAPGLAILQAEEVYRPLLNDGSLLARVAGHDVSPFSDPDDPGPARLFGFTIPELRQQGSSNDRFFNRKASYRPFALDAPLATRSWEVYRAGAADAYRTTAYSKPTLLLRTLEGQIGEDAMLELLRTWTRRFAFRHPGSADFIAVADEVTGGRYHDFLVETIHGSEVIDLAVEDVRCRKVEPPKGYLLPERPGGEVQTAFPPAPAAQGIGGWFAGFWERLAGTDRAATTSAVDAAAEDVTYESQVVVRNRGRLWLPSLVELRFADGSRERVPLDERRPWFLIERRTSSPLVAAIVDPDRTIALDLDVTNNGRRARADGGPARTLALFHQFWVQSWLAGVAWFA